MIKVRLKLISSFFIIIIFFLSSCSAVISLDDFISTTLTTLPKELHESPSIALWGQNVHVVWNTQDFENSTVYYKKSVNNGKTWENTTKLSYNTTSAYYPQIAVNENTVHVVWTDYRDYNSEIYYKKSTNNGETWDTAQRLTFDSPIKNNIYDIVIVADGDNVYLSWKDYRAVSSEIFFKKSTDNGETWTDNHRLTNDYTPSYYPSLAVNGNHLFLAFQDGGLNPDICFLKSDSSGNEWSEKAYIIETEKASKKPIIAVSGNKLYLVWQDDRTGNREIYFKKGNDHGETWGETQQLTYNSTSCISPDIYTYNENIIVVWHDMINETFWISYKTSSDYGETWADRKQLTSDTDCYSVNMVGESDNVHIIYQEHYSGSWADIWHIGNHSRIPPPIPPEPQQNTSNETPGFQFTFLLSIIFILVFTIQITSKRKKKDN